MRAYSVNALVLRTYRYDEADRIVVFLTEDRGKKRGVAKNASASRRRFGAALEPLTCGRVAYVEREHRDLVRVDRIEPRRTPLAAATGRSADEAVRALGHAEYFAELIDEWAPESAPNERLYRLGAAMSETLGGGGSVDALARYFEYWLLRLEGVYPSLELCGRCGRRTLGEGAILAIGDRAYVCADCGHGGPRLSRDAMTFLRSAVSRAPADIVALGGPAAALKEIEIAHDRLIALHLEKELRSARVVRQLGHV